MGSSACTDVPLFHERTGAPCTMKVKACEKYERPPEDKRRSRPSASNIFSSSRNDVFDRNTIEGFGSRIFAVRFVRGIYLLRYEPFTPAAFAI
jgi:hypothetical protein